jgi:hypothetical protein
MCKIERIFHKINVRGSNRSYFLKYERRKIMKIKKYGFIIAKWNKNLNF